MSVCHPAQSAPLDGLQRATSEPFSTVSYRHSDFEDFLKHHQSEGTNLLGQKRWYVSLSALEEFWEEKTINAVLHGGGRIVAADARTIRASYLKVWSTLVHLGRPEFIEYLVKCQFDDNNLPMKPGGGPISRTEGPALAEMIDLFCKYQWPFIPVEFREMDTKRMHKRELDDCHVLPIEYGRTLSGAASETVSVKEVRLHDSCTDNLDKHVVFKEFHAEEGRGPWSNEVNTLMMLSGCDDVVKYFGSFEQHNKLVIILEYANRGSLLDVFETNQQPRSADQVKKFWHALMKLLHALHRLHHSPMGFGSAHRDIKPANILVFAVEGGGSFDFRMKLADFDRATEAQRSWGMAPMGTQDNDGSHAYCAPEASRIYASESDTTLMVPHICDVWSLGCVASEALAWMAGGEELRNDYERRRKVDTSRICNMTGSGFEACFHDRTGILPCVKAMHEEAMHGLRKFDIYSPVVKSIIEQYMLLPHDKGRLDAMTVWHHFQLPWSSLAQGEASSRPTSGETETRATPAARRTMPPLITTSTGSALEDSRFTSFLSPETRPIASPQSEFEQSSPEARPINGLGIMRDTSHASSSTVTRHSSHASRHGQAPTQDRASHPTDLACYGPAPQTPGGRTTSVNHTPSPKPSEIGNRRAPYPHVQVADVLHWKGSKTNHPIPGREHLRDLKGRDQVFVMDDSSSMRAHRTAVMDTGEALMYLVKDCDPNGLEMRFTSEPKKVYKGKRFGFGTSTTKLRKQIGERFDATSDRRGSGGLETCNMELKLGTVIGDVVRKGRPVSIYVMTDGVWEGTGASKGGGVENTILQLVEKMRTESISRTDVSIQFIQFGDDPVGTDRLTYLDNDLKEEGRPVLDIVDHRHHTESVWLMLIGAMSGVGDNYRSSPPRGDGKETGGE